VTEAEYFRRYAAIEPEAAWISVLDLAFKTGQLSSDSWAAAAGDSQLVLARANNGWQLTGFHLVPSDETIEAINGAPQALAAVAPEGGDGTAAIDYLAACHVATDQPAPIHQRIVLIARITDRGVEPVDPGQSALPETGTWYNIDKEPVAVDGARFRSIETINVDGSNVLTVGSCGSGEALFSTLPLRVTTAAAMADAKTLNKRVADRRRKARASNPRAQTFLDERWVKWLTGPKLGSHVLRVSYFEEGWSLCEAGDVCGSSHEKKYGASSAVGQTPAAVEVVVDSSGC
jgi:hypothetical protein